MKAKDVKKILNVTQPTLSKYVKTGILKVIKINAYHYEYLDEDVYKLIGNKNFKKEKYNISYSRVSSQQQIQSLKEQSQRIYEYCISKGIDLQQQFEDIKSGMSFDRKNFSNLIEKVIKGEIGLIIIENKDRIVRFGFEMLELIFKYYGTKILVINDSISNKTYEQELSDDLISIIHHFSMKMYSNRRKLNKIKKILLQEEMINDSPKV